MNFSTELSAIVGQENFTENMPLSRLCTFGTGGSADLYITPPDLPALLQVLDWLKANEIPFFLLGRGSNILASDEGYRGAVVSLKKHLNKICIYQNTLVAEAGAMLQDTARAAQIAGLSGLEFASGIPGTVGGGLFMNAGAYGGELKDVVRLATVIFEDGSVEEMTAKEMELSYRHSVFSEKPRIILSVEMELENGDPAKILEKTEELNARRREKQPLEYPSAGSTFKRPEGHYAGALIEEAGLKGFSFGGACVSEKHAGFVINKGNATSSDIFTLTELIREKVFENSGVKLEREIRLLGDFKKEQ